MLQCYFDDSGTHEGSPVAVWGGVIGGIEQFAPLEEEWNDLLARPPHGMPPLKKFSQSEIWARRGEFSDYSDAEADHIQFLFRDILLKSGLVPVAYATDVVAWDRHVTGNLRGLLGSAQSASFALCAKAAIKASDQHKEKVSMVFDLGASDAVHDKIFVGMKQLMTDPHMTPSMTYAPVLGTPGLQVADLVAGQFRRFAIQWLRDPTCEPDPHFRALFKANQGFVDGLMDDQQIAEMASAMRLRHEGLRG